MTSSHRFPPPGCEAHARHQHDALEHGLDILAHLAVPESQHLTAKPFKDCCALQIRRQAFRVVAAIQFDNEFRIQRTEVHDERPNRLPVSTRKSAFVAGT